MVAAEATLSFEPLNNIPLSWALLSPFTTPCRERSDNWRSSGAKGGRSSGLSADWLSCSLFPLAVELTTPLALVALVVLVCCTVAADVLVCCAVASVAVAAACGEEKGWENSRERNKKSALSLLGSLGGRFQRAGHSRLTTAREKETQQRRPKQTTTTIQNPQKIISNIFLLMMMNDCKKREKKKKCFLLVYCTRFCCCFFFCVFFLGPCLSKAR